MDMLERHENIAFDGVADDHEVETRIKEIPATRCITSFVSLKSGTT